MGTPVNNTDTNLDELELARKREKDTRAAYTKGQQELKELKEMNRVLAEQATGTVTLSEEQQDELEDLKYSDPDAWRRKLNNYEAVSSKEAAEKLQEVQQKAATEFELDRRKQVLDEFNSQRDNPITDDVIKNDIPPRILAKLESGEIEFEQFLGEVDTYLGKGKVVSNPSTLSQPNLGNTGGGRTPSSSRAGASFDESYEDTVW